MLSLIGLLGGTGLVLFFVGKYDLLGWHRADEEEPGRALRFRPPEDVRLAPAQRATAWYFLVVAGLFLLQGLLGGANAHYHVEPGGFYGFDIGGWLPYNLSRTWHVQLALFFVAASYLAMGIFIAPMIAGHEPRHQDKLAIALFAAVVFVVLGSLAGEAASIKGALRPQRRLVLGGRPGLGISRPGATMANPAGARHVSVGGHPDSRPAATPGRRASRQSALSLSVQRPVDSRLLRRRPGVRQERQLCRHGLLAVLGRASVGGGFPGTVHDDHGGVHLRAPGRGSPRHGHAGRLSRYHALLHRRRDRHHAPSLFQRGPGRAHGPGRHVLRHGGHPPGVVDLRGLAVHAAGSRTDPGAAGGRRQHCFSRTTGP